MTFMLGDVAVDRSLPRGYAYRVAHIEVVSRTSGRMARTIEGKDKDSADEMMADSQLLVNYRGSRWVGGLTDPADRLDSPRPGDRAPDVQPLGRHFVARPIQLFELMRGIGHTLLFYADESA